MSITVTQGSIFCIGAQAAVIPVNCKGIMGNGLALYSKNRFPENYNRYRRACLNGDFSIGKILVTEVTSDPYIRYIINFPTKDHWLEDSKLSFIEEGLVTLKKVIESSGIESIAIPPLGCGKGKLDWDIVKPLVVQHLKGLDAEIYLVEYDPA